MLEQIKNQIFKETGEKLDAYSLAIIKANILANQKVVDSNNLLLDKFKGSINTNNYNLHGFSAWKVFLFRWGWGLYIVLGIFGLWGCIYTYYELKEPEFPIIIKGDDGLYGIRKENYTVQKAGIVFHPEGKKIK